MVGWSRRNRRRDDDGPYVPLTPEQKIKDEKEFRILTIIVVSLLFIVVLILLGDSRGPEKRVNATITRLHKIGVGVPVPVISKYLVELTTPNGLELRFVTGDLSFPAKHTVGESINVSYYEEFFYGRFCDNSPAKLVE